MYQINYLRCIGCGLCVEACPTRALTMTNDYEMADDNRADLIYEKDRLLAPLSPGMTAPPHPMAPGATEAGLLPRQRAAVTGLATEPTLVALAHADGAARTSTGEAVQFWLLGVAGGDRRAGHGRRRAKRCTRPSSWPPRCSSWRCSTWPEGALFLGVVQIVVYTGAVMMLFLFVLMLIGVDSAESLVETLRGQRIADVRGGLGLRRAADRRDRQRRHGGVGRPGHAGQSRRQRAGLGAS